MSQGDRSRSVQAFAGAMERVEPVVNNDAEGLPTAQIGLRLLFAVDSRFPGIGGAERQALKLARALRERGHSVEFVVPRILPSQAREETFDGFRIRRLDYPHVRYLGSLYLMGRVAAYFIQHRSRFDALHIHIAHLMAASAGYARRFLPWKVTTKVSGFYEFEGGVLDPRRRLMPLNLLIRTGLRQIDHVQTISEQTREKLLQVGFREAQISFVPNGIDTAGRPAGTAREILPGDAIRIGYCGRLRAVKGVHVLLDGVARACQLQPALKLQLHIAGGGETRDELDAQVAELGIADHVIWHGEIEHTVPFYRELDLYVQPSFAEGLPNSVMEAMLAGLPVLATDIGGNQDLITDGETGRLFPAGDSEQLAKLLVSLAGDQAARQSLGESGRQCIEKTYGFDTVVGQLLDLYRG